MIEDIGKFVHYSIKQFKERGKTKKYEKDLAKKVTFLFSNGFVSYESLYLAKFIFTQ